jgi:hypothetical protein
MWRPPFFYQRTIAFSSAKIKFEQESTMRLLPASRG